MTDDEGVGSLLFPILIIGGFIVGLGYLWMEQNEQIENFEATEATVLSSEVAESERSGRPTSYRPDINYQYPVDGQTYESSSVFPGPGGESKNSSQDGKEWAEGIIADHPAGEQVTAYYDPEDPSRAFLLKNRSWGVLIALIVVILTAGIYVLGKARD